VIMMKMMIVLGDNDENDDDDNSENDDDDNSENDDDDYDDD